MANYQLIKKEKSHTKFKKNKVIGIILITISTLAFLGLFTNLLWWWKAFLFGILGLFSYPVFIILFVCGLALINNKKYVMPKRYIIYISMAVISVLSIIDLSLTYSFKESYGTYLVNSYLTGVSAGGFFIGFLTAPFRYLFTPAGAIVTFVILLIASIALIADFFYYAKKFGEYKKPVKIVIPKVNSNIVGTPMEKKVDIPRENVNLTLNAEIQNVKDLSAKEKLGLLKNETIEKSSNIQNNKLPIENRVSEKTEEKTIPLKEYLTSKSSFTPPPTWFRDLTQKNDIQKNINELKNDSDLIKPEIVVHDDFNLNNYNIDNSKISNTSYIIENSSNNSELNVSTQSNQDVINDLEQKVLQSLNDNPNIDINANIPETPLRRRTNFDDFNSHNEPKANEISTVNNKIKPPQEYVIPATDLFTTTSISPDELNEDIVGKRAQLEYALETFNVPAKVIAVIIGPAVTRYELEMPTGISVKKILAHADDIALTLASKGDIRIEAPIPGKSAVGIEVPNDKIATVGMREMLNSKEFIYSKSPLTVVLGKDISGSIQVCDLTKMPHLLVAGATNSGKSVCLNAIIVSLLYKCSPKDLQLVLIDPKRVEFSMYNDLPHLVMPKVINDTDKAINALNWAIIEMERRFGLLQDTKCRNIQEYNSRNEVVNLSEEKLPFIVIIVDELADLMTVSKKDVEEKLLKLAQKARAAGIHMVLATQRPSVDVITGLIKANFPSRISFALTSFADSKTILDQGGADKLLGKGDMLYRPSDAPFPKRIQGCFMTGREVEEFVNFIKQHNEFTFNNEIEETINTPTKFSNNLISNDISTGDVFDELLPQALKLVIENGQASITILQRKLLIGYPRAARIIDQMEEAGFISSSDGSKPRSVYMTMEEWQKQFKND